MQENQTKDNEITSILAEINLPENGDKENTNTNISQEEEIETIHVYIYREEPKKNTTIVDADNVKEKTLPFGFVIACLIFSLLPIFSIAFQIFILLNPPTATITLVPIQKELSIETEIMAISNPGPNEILSVVLKPVTFSQSKTSPASGRGHQNASIIFTGPGGNIAAEDINTYSVGASILAQNTYAFRGGMDARDFSFVTSSDIGNVLNPLIFEVSQRVQTKLLSEVCVGQSLIPPSCSSKIFSDHKINDEATQVKVTVSQTCMGVTYDIASLQEKGSQILMNLAQKTLGLHYFPIFGITVNILHASMHHILPIRAMVTVSIQGTWFYQFSAKENGRSKKSCYLR